MTDYRAFRICRIGGHVAFWLLIVSTLFAGGLTWLTVDDGVQKGARPYWGAADRHPDAVAGFDQTYAPWPGAAQTKSIVVVLVEDDSASSLWPSYSQLSLACAAVFVLAAVGESIVLRKHPKGLLTAAVAVVVVALLWSATPGAINGVELKSGIAFIFVLAAIALREIWFRWAAPTLASPTEPVATEEA